MLELVLSNSVLDGTTLEVTFREPFGLIAKATTEAAKENAAGGGSDGVHQVWLGYMDLNHDSRYQKPTSCH